MPPHNDEDYLLRSLAAISKELPTAAVDPMYGQIGAFIVNTHGAGHQRFDEVNKCAFVWFGVLVLARRGVAMMAQPRYPAAAARRGVSAADGARGRRAASRESARETGGRGTGAMGPTLVRV